MPTRHTVKSAAPVDARPRDYLPERELELFSKAAKQGRHDARDYAMVLLAYRHGLRMSDNCSGTCGRQGLDTGRCPRRYSIIRAAGADRNDMTISEVIRKWFRAVPVGLVGVWLTACMASQAPGPGGLRPAYDRMLLAGDIYVAETHLRDFGYDPGPVDGRFTAETQAAVRAYQARYGLPITGMLDLATRRELVPGLDEVGFTR
jgi:integrase